MEIALPDASLRLVQACGRLIRSETDTGKISIFDNRLKTKFYGKQLLDALPGYNIVIE
jgi:ATP-dependent DNA helicase DinG